jgi:hypothetical protein
LLPDQGSVGLNGWVVVKTCDVRRTTDSLKIGVPVNCSVRVKALDALPVGVGEGVSLIVGVSVSGVGV